MPGWLIEALALFFLFSGTAFCVIGTYGILRLPDIYTRLQAAGMIFTMGALCIAVSLLLAGPLQAGLKSLATALFLLLTGPLVTHVLARISHQKGVKMSAKAMRDDLKEDNKTGSSGKDV